jgi:adenylate kinase
MKRVILITGTPCTGKTTLAQNLTTKLQAQYINLSNLAETENLTVGKDLQRDTTIIDEAKMYRKLKQIIEQSTNPNIIIDGHYAAAVTPKDQVTTILVLRRNPKELRTIMQQRNYTQQKQDENIAAEILDVCLTEALQEFSKEKICEIDTTNQISDQTLQQATDIVDGKKPCTIGNIDWLGQLEREGKLEQYLKT